MYAKNNNGVRITAEPGVVATCPNCGNEVKAKCGDIKIRRVLAIFTTPHLSPTPLAYKSTACII